MMDAAATLLSTLGVSSIAGQNDLSGSDVPSLDDQILSNRLQKWNETIEREFMAAPSLEASSLELKEDQKAALQSAADVLHNNLVQAILVNPSLFAGSKQLPLVCGIGEGDRTDAVGGETGYSNVDIDDAGVAASRAAVAVRESKAAKLSEYDDKEVQKLVVVSDILRACKNVLRWTNQCRAKALRYRGQPSHDEASRLVADDATRILRSSSALRLYLTLLECCSSHFQKGSTDLTPRDCVAQTASLALFHATFGAGEPVADAARSALVGPNVNFIPSLARLIQRPHPLPLLISLMRHLHSLVGSKPTSVSSIDSAVTNSGGVNDSRDEPKDKNLATVLVATLAWTIRSDPPFPGTNPSDRRSDLAVEVLRIMFVLQSKSRNDIDKDIMTEMGILICDILQLPNADFRAYDTKLAALNLLMDCPLDYGQYLLLNGGIPPLLTILTLQLNTVVVERTGSGSADAAAILPILLALTRLSAAGVEVRRLIKEGVFPLGSEDDFRTKAQAEREKLHGSASESAGGVRAKNMAPLDAPKGTVRWMLVRLMTWTESNVKRCASELLWALCGGDATEFVLRTGFGNAIHMLGIKGLMALPKDSFS